MGNLPGVFAAKRKDGRIYYRSSVTYQNKHISLGSFEQEESAHQAYRCASTLLTSQSILTPEDYEDSSLSFSKWVTLTNFKNNRIYIKTPIYLRTNFFHYYLSQTDVLLFDVDDLFYYSTHTIMRRGSHLFVADYGMQVNIASRYGIKNHAVRDKDYRFVNGDDRDMRYGNIEIINPYYGVSLEKDGISTVFLTKIHINGSVIVGRYPTLTEAAIAYNKAVDCLTRRGLSKNYTQNYLDGLSTEQYREIYRRVTISDKLLHLRLPG